MKKETKYTIFQVVFNGVVLFALVFLLSYFWTNKGNWPMSLAVGLAFGLLGAVDGYFYALQKLKKIQSKTLWAVSLLIASFLFFTAAFAFFRDSSIPNGAAWGFVGLGAISLITAGLLLFKKK